MFKGRFTKDGGLNFGDYTRRKLKEYMKANPGMPFEIKPLIAESSKQRGWFEGALVPLVTFYQEELDHRDSQDLEKVREWLKIEFNAELVTIAGKVHKVGQSTKRKLNQGFLERIVDYLEENYATPEQALNPTYFKNWKDTIFPYGGPDNFIDYLVENKILTKDPIKEDFSLSKEIEKLEANPRRDLNIMALYLRYRKPDIQNKKQYQIAFTRHVKPAGQLVSFTDSQIVKAIEYAKLKYEDYTLETLLKILIK
jgi:hypothetical protein